MSITIWNRSPAAADVNLERLVQAVRCRGAGAVAREWPPSSRIAWAHGARPDLWWEFALSDSFRWQGFLFGIPAQEALDRSAQLAAALGLSHVLSRRVESLAPAQCTLANLAVALLPKPSVLLWEQPFLLLSQPDRDRAAQLVRRLVDTEALTAILISEEGVPDARIHQSQLHAAGSGRSPGPARGLAAAGGSRWPEYVAVDRRPAGRTGGAAPWA